MTNASAASWVQSPKIKSTPPAICKMAYTPTKRSAGRNPRASKEPIHRDFSERSLRTPKSKKTSPIARRNTTGPSIGIKRSGKMFNIKLFIVSLSNYDNIATQMKECVLILDNIRSVENVGSIFRTAEGFGVSKIILVGITPAPVDRFGRKRTDFSKVSLGAEDLVPWEQVETSDLGFKIQDLRMNGFKIIALEQHPNSKKLEASTKHLEPFVLIVGSEVDGVSKEALELADDIVEIPMMGEKESLNVSVATGVALYNLLK